MKRTALIILLLFVSMPIFAWAMGSKPKMPDRLTAIIETNQGNITCILFGKEAPKTVENFVGLAQGTIEWTDPKTLEKVKRPLYDGVIFHRVIPGFMIQGGDPLGIGIGGPGYRFEDEIAPELIFDKSGILAMANSGPNTNGSQFFITVAPTPWLNGHHTIFGQVTSGQDVVEKIALVKRDGRDKPIEPVIIQKILIKE
jgi:peptidyl-prolyl cis-trans isomerase A (cyclophilin A)